MSRLNRFLDGVRIVDLTSYFPGPLATLLLADLGATVIKVEPPQGDAVRTLGPRDAEGRPAYYEAMSAGKQCVTLDLKSHEGRAAFLALSDGADVVIESFRPDVMPRLGLASSLLRERNPRLVYVSISGYGRTGPQAGDAGHDVNYLASAGALTGNGAGDSAAIFAPPIADCLGSMFGMSTLLAALYARERDGRGADIDIALADVVMPLQTFALAEMGASGSAPARERDLLNGGAAFYRIYVTSDGAEVALGAIEPKFWAAFCDAADHPEWTARHGELLPQTSLIDEVTRYFAATSIADCRKRFAPADCCWCELVALDAAVASERMRARRLVRRDSAGAWQALYPAWVDGEPPLLRKPRT
jgi:crotonobetainyl-CoA:carnitine CoA-transferase CaiB-like acyl-CoA transferase